MILAHRFCLLLYPIIPNYKISQSDAHVYCLDFYRYQVTDQADFGCGEYQVVCSLVCFDSTPDLVGLAMGTFVFPTKMHGSMCTMALSTLLDA